MTTSLAMSRPPVRGARKRPTPGTRPVSQKRVNAMRFSWFVIGSLFGVTMSFMMNLFVSSVVIPEYQGLVASRDQAAETTTLDSLPFEETKNGDQPTVTETVERKPAYPKHIATQVQNGDTLLNILVDAEVDYDEAVDVIEALKKTYDPHQLRVGQKISLQLDAHPVIADKAAVSKLNIRVNKLDTVKLNRLPGGAFFAEKATKEIKPELVLAGGTITSSLFQTGYDTGVPDGVLTELMNAYSYDVDLQREIHNGDQMEVLFERLVTDEGDSAGYGKIYYAMLNLRGKERKIYRFEDKKGHVGFYDEKGESIVKALLKTPVSGARISSGYGKRRHPILGYTKMHKGTDFAAPTGTPIYAAGDGVIAYKGRKGGYGNYIKIRHNDKYATAYAHMSRFGKGMQKGRRVKQGQIIGYVGTTGRSTGAHLHYEVHKYGRQVNPMREKFKTGKVLKNQELAQFKREILRIKNKRASIPKSQTTIASSK